MEIEDRIIDLAKKRFLTYSYKMVSDSYGNHHRLWTFVDAGFIPTCIRKYRIGDEEAIEWLTQPAA